MAKKNSALNSIFEYSENSGGNINNFECQKNRDGSLVKN